MQAWMRFFKDNEPFPISAAAGSARTLEAEQSAQAFHVKTTLSDIVDRSCCARPCSLTPKELSRRCRTPVQSSCESGAETERFAGRRRLLFFFCGAQRALLRSLSNPRVHFLPESLPSFQGRTIPTIITTHKSVLYTSLPLQ